jgi:glycosyltransferase involved in cell wall biosynthesis
MNVLVNCSTLVVGGGIQVGLGFIKVSHISPSGNNFLYLVSPGIYKDLSDSILDSGRVILCNSSPGTLFGWIQFHLLIKNQLKKFQPDVVYSLGYPSYYSFPCVEVGRYTNPWDFFPEPLPWHLVGGVRQRMVFSLKCAIRRYFAKKATHIETQTEFAKQSIVDSLHLDTERVTVIPNSINPEYYKFRSSVRVDHFQHPSEPTAFCLSADHLHKNLAVIPRVCYELKNTFNISVKFVLTLAVDSESWSEIFSEASQLGVQDLVINAGLVAIQECIDLYKSSTFVFLPTLLEIFSATYLEAMCMGVPIVTSDLHFAKDICENAALYVNPYDAHHMAKKISELLSSPSHLTQLVANGQTRLDTFPDSSEKLSTIYSMFNHLLIKHHN